MGLQDGVEKNTVGNLGILDSISTHSCIIKLSKLAGLLAKAFFRFLGGAGSTR